MPFRLCFLLLLSFKLYAQLPLLDERDGTIYPTVRIGSQVWMQENLRYAMPGAAPLPPQVDKRYGYLYTWRAAVRACPEGWHLPSDIEWQHLERYLGIPEEELALRSKYRGANKAVATQLTAMGYFPEHDKYAATYGKSGFNALPAGVAIQPWSDETIGNLEEMLERQLDTFPPADVEYSFIGLQTSFWSSSIDEHPRTSHSAFVRVLERKYSDVFRFSGGMHVYYSCRCLRDEVQEQ